MVNTITALIARVEELEREREDIFLKDRLRTNEHNILTRENLELRARVAELEKALGKLIKACDEGRMVPRGGVSGMTIEAQTKNSVLNGVPAWPVEEAREVWEQSRAAITQETRDDH